MEKEILESWKHFQLTDLEWSVEVIDSNIPKEINRRESLCLLGFVVSGGEQGDLQSIDANYLALKGWVHFNEVGFNLFIIEFRET